MTIRAELIPTGDSTNSYPCACTALPPNTAVKAIAPLGRCRQRKKNMAPIEAEIATAAASTGSPISLAQVTPIVAERILPQRTDQGCAKGLDGTAKSKTAKTPINTINNNKQPKPMECPNNAFAKRPVNRMPTRAPALARMRSKRSTANDDGKQPFNQCNAFPMRSPSLFPCEQKGAVYMDFAIRPFWMRAMIAKTHRTADGGFILAAAGRAGGGGGGGGGGAGRAGGKQG